MIEALGGEVVEYDGARKCCGFPVITMNRETSLQQAGTHVGDAIDAGADCLVTPCPLCHLNLDMQQPEAAKVVNRDLGLAVLHLPQLVGLALGAEPKELGHEQAHRLDRLGRGAARRRSRLSAVQNWPRPQRRHRGDDSAEGDDQRCSEARSKRVLELVEARVHRSREVVDLPDQVIEPIVVPAGSPCLHRSDASGQNVTGGAR